MWDWRTAISWRRCSGETLGVSLGMCFAIQRFSTLEASDIWLAIVLGHFTRATLSVIVFRRGKWRDIEVDIGRARAAGTP